MKLTGAKSSKRNKCLVQNSPKRRATPDRQLLANGTTSTRGRKTQTKQKLILNEADQIASTSRPAPKGMIIPAIVKDRMDFQNPSKPLP